MAASNEVIAERDNSMSNEETMQRLVELFGNVLDLEIIQSVALSCKYNLESSSNLLVEMSTSIGILPQKLEKEESAKTNSRQPSLYAAVANAPCLTPSPYSSPPKFQKKVQNVSSPHRKSKKEQEFDRIVLHVKQGTKIIVFMRGLPGSGKSSLAKRIIKYSLGWTDYAKFILSADDFFINQRNGKYEYDRTKLNDAHYWNQHRAFVCMSSGISPVIIDNTNLEAWEMKLYVMNAVHFGYRIEIAEPFTPWAFDEKELAQRNTHGVPRTKIKEMLNRYEKNLTPNKLLAMWELHYTPKCMPPQVRLYPPIVYNVIQHVNSNSERNHNVTPVRGNREKNHCDTNDSKSPLKGQCVDLMDFESDIPFETGSCSSINEIIDSPLDTILMCNTEEGNADILKPDISKHNTFFSVHSEPKMKKLCTFAVDMTNDDSNDDVIVVSNSSDDEVVEADSNITKNAAEINKARNLYPTLNLSSWGLPENAISSWENSWDVVRPLNKPEQSDVRPSSKSEESDKVGIEEFKASVLSATVETSTNTSSADFALLNVNILPEDVKLLKANNRNINEHTLISPPLSPPKKILLDKSSMTNNLLTAALCREREANDKKHLAELVCLFPEIPVDSLKDVYEKCGKDLNWTVDLLLDDKKEILPQQLMTTEEQLEKTLNEAVNMNEHSEYIQKEMRELTIVSPEKKIENSDEAFQLKKHLEQNIEIDKSYYSEHVQKIRNQRKVVNNVISPQPSTSKICEFDAYATPMGEVIAVNSDVNLMNLEPDIDFPDSEEEEVIELNLGETVVAQLESKFGLPETFPRGFLPIIQIPVWLARQLHALYVESVLVQLENQNHVLELIVKEDEEFAKKLQEQENMFSQASSPKPLNLQEIMAEEAANTSYQKQTEEWKKLTPDNLAARLTQQKLCAAFPTVDKELLVEILYAHNNSYQQTVEVLLASTERDKIYDPDMNILEPPITESTIEEMKKAEEETKENINTPDEPKTAKEYREEAANCQHKHNELMQKAQQAYQVKQYQVAAFYSDLAKTYTRLYDQANNLAASAFLQEHSKKLQSFNTLDLHYLYVREAISALDMFLDTNIRLLQGSNKKSENLYIITGRGKRSMQGISRIKPAVIGRLKKRDIWFMEMNPGLLRIKVRPHSAITSSLT